MFILVVVRLCSCRFITDVPAQFDIKSILKFYFYLVYVVHIYLFTRIIEDTVPFFIIIVVAGSAAPATTTTQVHGPGHLMVCLHAIIRRRSIINCSIFCRYHCSI